MKYRNERNGDIVDVTGNDAKRLDKLDNWSKLKGQKSEPADPDAKPNKSASKADWVAYATAHGVSAKDADTANRDELAALFDDES